MIQKTNVWKTAAGLLLTISMMISSVPVTAVVVRSVVITGAGDGSGSRACGAGGKYRNL